DDDANRFLLHGYFRLDAYASREFGRHVEFFAAGENLFDRSIEVGKTPVLTLGTPQVARFGLREIPLLLSAEVSYPFDVGARSICKTELTTKQHAKSLPEEVRYRRMEP